VPYEIEFAPSAARQYKKLRGDIRERVETKVDSLAANPRPHGYEKLEGGDGHFRVRVGDFRIVYEIHDKKLVVLVVRIADRKDVYR
jgi:mRNA interferase RelE/StbE